MKKRISCLLAVMLAAALLPGCGKQKASSVQNTEPAYTLIIEDASSAEQTESAPETTSAESTASTAASPAETTSAPPQTTASDTTVYSETTSLTVSETTIVTEVIAKDGVYTTKDDVALYIYTYGELPQNFITKKEAQSLGWTGGSLERFAPGKCIGGTYFGNYEGKLPDKRGRKYTECDIDTLGKSSRGAKRIVFSNDGLIYYTEDHYQTFELLYGEE